MCRENRPKRIAQSRPVEGVPRCSGDPVLAIRDSDAQISRAFQLDAAYNGMTLAALGRHRYFSRNHLTPKVKTVGPRGSAYSPGLRGASGVSLYEDTPNFAILTDKPVFGV